MIRKSPRFNPPPYDVCAAVVSDLPYDARVWKEARSLQRTGRRVAIVGCRSGIRQTAYEEYSGIATTEVPLGGRGARPSVFGRVRTLGRVWLTVLRTPARVYHAHNIHTGPACWLACRLRRAHLVYDGHELYGELDGSGLRYAALARASLALERFMVRRSDAVITTNASRSDVLRERHGRQAITVLANVPELRGNSEVVSGVEFPREPVLLYHGGIYAYVRAFRETIEALRILPDVHFVILGFGRESEIKQIGAWAAEAGVAARVQILPPRPFDELVSVARRATVGLVPIKPINLGSYLGDTNKLFEYLAAGLPVAASDLPEIRRVVTLGDPQVGELFDPSSSESIAAAIDRIIRDPAYGVRRREAERLARERFNWGVEEGHLLDLYEQLLGKTDDHVGEQVGRLKSRG